MFFWFCFSLDLFLNIEKEKKKILRPAAAAPAAPKLGSGSGREEGGACPPICILIGGRKINGGLEAQRQARDGPAVCPAPSGAAEQTEKGRVCTGVTRDGEARDSPAAPDPLSPSS